MMLRRKILGAFSDNKAVIWLLASAALASLFFILKWHDPPSGILTEEKGRGVYRSLEAPQEECPSYFAWIYEDLAAWNGTGITVEHLTEAKRRGDFRLVIVGGELYFERYHECIQTRADITLYGLYTLIKRLPGVIPDMEMVFVCNDFPEVVKAEYQEKQPPPIFSYCTTRLGEHFDILFPDWSFWGWPQVKISPWERESVQIFQGSSRSNWSDREPVAYWKGNLWVMTKIREDLLKCNDTMHNVVVYYLDWGQEASEGYHTSSLANQCHNRYKIYVEGRGWSVSLKYVMSCGSTVLHIEPDYWEFFARSWLPFVEYFPISRDNLCESIRKAVDWGNAHPEEAAEIGRRGQTFLKEKLTMDHVYSYMVHVMQAYAKLQRFRPAVPEGVQPWTPNPSEFGNITAGVIKLCSMPSRDRRSIESIIARQAAGYL